MEGKLLIKKNRHFKVFVTMPLKHDDPAIIQNNKGMVISDDAIGFDLYGNKVFVWHADKTQSIFNKEGKPLEEAFHQKKLVVKRGFFGGIYYGKKLEERSNRFKRLSEFSSLLFWPCVTLNVIITLPLTCYNIKKMNTNNNQKKEEEAKAKAAVEALENKQQATLTKINGDIALFDVDGDKKADYTAHNLTVSDRVFLIENEGQTKTIGSWKGNLSNRAILMKYKRPQREKQ